MSPIIIDLDSWVGLIQTAGAMVLQILSMISFTVNQHRYTALSVFVSILIFSILLYHFWGDDDS